MESDRAKIRLTQPFVTAKHMSCLHDFIGAHLYIYHLTANGAPLPSHLVLNPVDISLEKLRLLNPIWDAFFEVSRIPGEGVMLVLNPLLFLIFIQNLIEGMVYLAVLSSTLD